MLGVSLSPALFLPQKHNRFTEKLLAEYGGLDALLRGLKALGVTHIELRSIRPDHVSTPEEALHCAQAVWNAGLLITVHAYLPDEIGAFANTYPLLLPILREFKNHQDDLILTVHSHITGSDEDKSAAFEKTNRHLRLWGEEAAKYGCRIALELNRDKKNGDPSVSPEGLLVMTEGVNPETVGFCFDFGHYYSNTRHLDNGSPAIPCEEMLRRSMHTHIHALALHNGKTHFPLDDTAALPLDAYVSSLVQQNYTGIYNLELDLDYYMERDLRQVLRASITALHAAVRRALPPLDAHRHAVQLATDTLYPDALAAIATEIAAPQPRDGFYTLCASGYVFCMGGQRFALDPAIRSAKARESSIEAMRAVLSQVSVVFITHEDEDHFDPALVRHLTDLPCQWVIGCNFSKDILARSGLRKEQICVAHPGDTLQFPGIRAQVFAGHHFAPDGKGAQAVMYLLTVNGKTLFFPGDVRDYGADRFPELDPPDVFFANVWLGRNQALTTSDAFYEEYCDYVAHFRPRRVFLGHLWEFTRDSANMWTWQHAGRVMDGLMLRLPATTTTPLQLFQHYDL